MSKIICKKPWFFSEGERYMIGVTNAFSSFPNIIAEHLNKFYPNNPWVKLDLRSELCVFPFVLTETKNWKWKWSKKLNVVFHNITEKDDNTFHYNDWVGPLEIIKKSTNEMFVIYKAYFFDHKCVFTNNVKLLEEFADEIVPLINKTDEQTILVYKNGSRVEIGITEISDNIFLDKSLDENVFLTIDTFFNHENLYKELGIPHKRGLLFVGPPGNGKTSTIKTVLKRYVKKHEATVKIIIPQQMRTIDFLNLIKLDKKEKTIIIFEDLDSLMSETGITRSTFLNWIDGIEQINSVLIIGTTNEPNALDPAFYQRPSRFDRVFYFDNPSNELKYKYLKWAFSNVEEVILQDLIKKMHNWSFAYLNEFRICSKMYTVLDDRKEVNKSDLYTALEKLNEQFSLGKKHLKNQSQAVGFK